nr:hypothetical protein HK105_001422 [Polyrhizophydium stewartii]
MGKTTVADVGAAGADYLEKYMTICERKQTPPLMLIKKTFEHAIDSGESPDILKLSGTQTELRYRRIDDDIAECIFQPMVGISIVRCVDLSYNEIGDRGAFVIAKVLKSSVELIPTLAFFMHQDDLAIEVLILRSNNITGEGAAAICKALTYNEKVTHMDLSGNAIGDEGGMAIASILQVNVNISVLILSGCSLAATSMIAFATVLQTNSSVNVLDISNNLLHTSNLTQTLVNDVMSHFALTMQLNYGIKELNFSKLGITDWNMCDLLANAIKANKNIDTLNLSCNRISRDGGVALCDALSKHASINNLILSCCSLQDEGATAIARVIRSNTKIKEIYLDYNKVSSIGLVAIADALRDSWSLKFIALWGNLWGEASCEAFAELMGGPTTSVCIGDPAGRPQTQAQAQMQAQRKANAPHIRLHPHMTDVSFYVVETTIHQSKRTTSADLLLPAVTLPPAITLSETDASADAAGAARPAHGAHRRFLLDSKDLEREVSRLEQRRLAARGSGTQLPTLGKDPLRIEGMHNQMHVLVSILMAHYNFKMPSECVAYLCQRFGIRGDDGSVSHAGGMSVRGTHDASSKAHATPARRLLPEFQQLAELLGDKPAAITMMNAMRKHIPPANVYDMFIKAWEDPELQPRFSYGSLHCVLGLMLGLDGEVPMIRKTDPDIQSKALHILDIISVHRRNSYFARRLVPAKQLPNEKHKEASLPETRSYRARDLIFRAKATMGWLSYSEIMTLVFKAQERGVGGTSELFDTFVRSLAASDRLMKVETLMSEISRVWRCPPDMRVCKTVFLLYARGNDFARASRVFFLMSERWWPLNVEVYKIMLRLSSRTITTLRIRQIEQERMDRARDAGDLRAILSSNLPQGLSAQQQEELRNAESALARVLAHIDEIGFEKHASLQDALMSAHALAGNVNRACVIFSQSAEHITSRESLKRLILELLTMPDGARVMLPSQSAPDAAPTAVSPLQVVANVLAHMRDRDIQPPLVVYKMILRFYIQRCNPGETEQMIRSILNQVPPRTDGPVLHSNAPASVRLDAVAESEGALVGAQFDAQDADVNVEMEIRDAAMPQDMLAPDIDAALESAEGKKVAGQGHFSKHDFGVHGHGGAGYWSDGAQVPGTVQLDEAFYRLAARWAARSGTAGLRSEIEEHAQQSGVAVPRYMR